MCVDVCVWMTGYVEEARQAINPPTCRRRYSFFAWSWGGVSVGSRTDGWGAGSPSDGFQDLI